MKPDQRLTNVEFVVDLMQFSAHGALIQAFVLQALADFAQRVALADPETLNTGLVSGRAWRGCAIEVQQKLEHYLWE